ncbi:hypothetical protein GCM10027456_13540 [Kineosporia babensis]
MEQDHLRRKILRERDIDPGLAPAFIEHNVSFLLEHGYHVILEGILFSARYAPMLHRLSTEHGGPSHFFYFNVSFAETARRHRTRPQAAEFTPEEMQTWYQELDLLEEQTEAIIPESSTQEQTLAYIAAQLNTG